MAATLVSAQAWLIALRDCALLNLSGLHAPHFLRVIFRLDFGAFTGAAEVPGDRRILDILNGDYLGALLRGRALTLTELTAAREELAVHYAGLDQGGRGLQTFDTRVLVHVIAALETAWLDAYAKSQSASVADVLAAPYGVAPRTHAEVNGYLFFVADTVDCGLDYCVPEPASCTAWETIRRLPTPTPESFARTARAAHDRYGFRYWKLKGGVYDAQREAEFVEAAYAEVRGNWTLDPNGAWTVEEADRVIARLRSSVSLAYMEDPCFGLDAMAEVHRRTGVPNASNMVGTDWPSLFQAIGRGAVQYPLADPHFWGGPRLGLEVIRAVTHAGCRAGVHSNNHGLLSLACAVHMLAAAPPTVLAADTHYIFTDRDEDPVVSALEIRDGAVEIPRGTLGLGVELDSGKLARAQAAAAALGAGERNDAVQMRRLPGRSNWIFDPHRPALLR